MDETKSGLPAAVEETLRTIERRARGYRRLVQVLVLAGLAFLAFSLFRSLVVLLYAPTICVLFVGVWMAADSAEVRRWGRGLAQFKISTGALEAVLNTRKDVPTETLRDMIRSLPAEGGSTYWILISILCLAVALACAARAIEVKSLWWTFSALTAFFGFAMTRLRM